jgi:hypothetical protein
MQFRTIKITELMGKIGLVAEHSKPVQSRNKLKNKNKPNKNATTVLNILNS